MAWCTSAYSAPSRLWPMCPTLTHPHDCWLRPLWGMFSVLKICQSCCQTEREYLSVCRWVTCVFIETRRALKRFLKELLYVKYKLIYILVTPRLVKCRQQQNKFFIMICLCFDQVQNFEANEKKKVSWQELKWSLFSQIINNISENRNIIQLKS